MKRTKYISQTLLAC